MKKKLLGGLLVVAILATASVVAIRANTTEASAKSHSERGSILAQDGVDADQSESTDKPFVGIAIASVPEDSETNGVLIVRVLEGSPADGVLQADDIITAVGDELVDGPRDVVRIVRERSPGDLLVFTVARDGSSMAVSITLGELESSGYERGVGKRGGPGGVVFGRAGERLVLSDTRYMTDDGVKTVRKAVGTAQNIDVNAGTFDLLLRDESEALSFIIGDDTKVAADTAEGEASLSDLSTDATTMVVQVTKPDGTSEVQLVAQGEFSLTIHSLFGRDGFRMMPQLERKGSGGFSSRGFFFRWRGGSNDERDGHGEGRGRGHD